MPGRFHVMQIGIAAGLAALLAALYVAAPDGKSSLLGGAVMTLIGFVAGKFSNGFPKGAGGA